MSIKNLEAILAIDAKNGLAKNNDIPWKCKTDMTFFKNKTTGNIVIMGVKTLLSLPNSRPLNNRTNIVVTNNKEKYSNIYSDNANLLFLDLSETFTFINQNQNKQIFIIGGNQIYNIFLPYCSTIWLTRIKHDYECDLLFDFDISIYTKNIVYEDNEVEIICLNH